MYLMIWGEKRMTQSSILEFHESENNSFLVKHTLTNKFIKMGLRETAFLRFLSAGETGGASPEDYTGELNEEEQRYLVQKFMEWGFLDPDGHPVSQEEPEGRERRWKWNWRTDDITTIKFLSVNPDEWLTARLPLIRKLVHPATVALYVMLILFSGYLLVSQPEAVQSLQLQQLSIGSYITIYFMILLTTAIHEISHGMMCKYYGGRVNQMGLMLFYFSPAMFCDVSDTYLFKRRRHKLAVLFAGIFSQWTMSAVAVILYSLLIRSGTEVPLLFYYAIANLGISMINIIPLVKLDGYWMLSHGLGIANLRTRAFRLFFQWINPWHKEGGEQEQQKSAAGREKIFLWLYGLSAALFTPLFWSWGLYNIQTRLYSLMGGLSFVITAGIGCVLLYHLAKFIRVVYKPA